MRLAAHRVPASSAHPRPFRGWRVVPASRETSLSAFQAVRWIEVAAVERVPIATLDPQSLCGLPPRRGSAPCGSALLVAFNYPALGPI
jgi:hypothetical protein